MTGQVQIGRDFILAGNATFTIIGQSTRFTFKVTKKEPEAGSRFRNPAYFVALMTGSNNESDYTYLGMLAPAVPDVILTKGSRLNDQAPAVVAIRWALKRVLKGLPLPAPAAIIHEGKCGKCGRKLTTPESIQRGFGPDCWEELGLSDTVLTGPDDAGPSIFESEL